MASTKQTLPEQVQTTGGSSPRFSVGILTFNSAETLEDCLKAVFAQGIPRAELDVFIVDSGSRDRTIQVAEDFGLLIYSEPGCPRGRGRNICIEKAKSAILVMLDSDIVIPEGWLSKVERYFADPSIMEVASPYFTPPPKLGMIRRVIYYLTSGWEVHTKGALEREKWA